LMAEPNPSTLRKLFGFTSGLLLSTSASVLPHVDRRVNTFVKLNYTL
jgi:hypothetical protein